MTDPYYIDFKARVTRIQDRMADENIDIYLGSRLRTLSWVSDVFCPWRSFIVIPAQGMPALFSFVIDAARIADETWMDEDQVFGFAPMGGQDQIEQIADYINGLAKGKPFCLGIESGMSNYLPEGNLTQYEYEKFSAAMPSARLVNAHSIIDRLALIKDEGTINRFKEASRIVDIGHEAVFQALQNGGWKGMTETEIAGLAAHAMRKAGSEFEWSFTGGNEIASGYRTGYTGGACTPATRRALELGDPLMVDIHSMYKLGLGDHSHNYFIGEATDRQRWHADNFVDIVSRTLETYKAGITPCDLAEQMMAFAESRGFSDYMVPGFEHGIGLMGDEWRIGLNDGPFPYWTNPEHIYQENEVLICAIQYACPEEKIGFRYENPILIHTDHCEEMSKFKLSVDEIV